MSKYKLVPVEPTEKMLAAYERASIAPVGPISKNGYKAMLAAAPTVHKETVGWQFYQDGKWWFGDDRIKNHRRNTEEAGYPIREVYALATCTSNADREQVTEVEAAPSHGLPNWSECNLRVGNSEWLKDNDREPEDDSLTANPLHEFIYEYDDSDAYKSAWFLHRLEKLIDFIRSEQVPAPDVSALVEVLESLLEVQDEDCRYDHQGYCQNHNLDHVDDGCRVARAKTALAAYRNQGGEV